MPSYLIAIYYKNFLSVLILIYTFQTVSFSGYLLNSSHEMFPPHSQSLRKQKRKSETNSNPRLFPFLGICVLAQHLPRGEEHLVANIQSENFDFEGHRGIYHSKRRMNHIIYLIADTAKNNWTPPLNNNMTKRRGYKTRSIKKAEFIRQRFKLFLAFILFL